MIFWFHKGNLSVSVDTETGVNMQFCNQGSVQLYYEYLAEANRLHFQGRLPAHPSSNIAIGPQRAAHSAVRLASMSPRRQYFS